MRGLTREEHAHLQELARPARTVRDGEPGDPEAEAVKRLVDRGLVVVRVVCGPERFVRQLDEHTDLVEWDETWSADITEDGRLALRTCTVDP